MQKSDFQQKEAQITSTTPTQSLKQANELQDAHNTDPKTPIDTETTSDSDLTNITFLSFNIFIKPMGYHSNEDDHKNTRLTLFLKQIAKYDIISFQEMHNDFSGRLKRLLSEASTKGLGHSHIGKSRPLLSNYKMCSGLATVSKFQIVEKGFYKYKSSCGKDARMFKGVTYTRIKLKTGKFVKIFNTHLQHSPDKEFRTSRRLLYIARINQYAELREFIESCLKKSEIFDTPSDIVLICGTMGLNARRCAIPVSEIDLQSDLEDENAKNWILENLYEAGSKQIEVFSEYELMLAALAGYDQDRIYDLLFEQNDQKLSVTFGDCYNKNRRMLPREKVLTPKNEQLSEKSIDFLFELKKSRNGKFDKMVDCECKLIPFFVDMEEDEEVKKKVTQLSSHYGIRLKFKI